MLKSPLILCLQCCLPQPAPLVTSFSLYVPSSDSVSPTALARTPAKSLISFLLDLVFLPNLSPTFTDSVSLVFFQSLWYINFQGSYHFSSLSDISVFKALIISCRNSYNLPFPQFYFTLQWEYSFLNARQLKKDQGSFLYADMEKSPKYISK